MTVTELKLACKAAKNGHVHLATQSEDPPFPPNRNGFPAPLEVKQQDGVIYFVYDANPLLAAIENAETAMNAFVKVQQQL